MMTTLATYLVIDAKMKKPIKGRWALHYRQTEVRECNAERSQKEG
jgi:hypothetical protein